MARILEMNAIKGIQGGLSSMMPQADQFSG
jgi:hypothetical protein